jgi:hypothetical protein
LSVEVTLAFGDKKATFAFGQLKWPSHPELKSDPAPVNKKQRICRSSITHVLRTQPCERTSGLGFIIYIEEELTSRPTDGGQSNHQRTVQQYTGNMQLALTGHIN